MTVINKNEKTSIRSLRENDENEHGWEERETSIHCVILV